MFCELSSIIGPPKVNAFQLQSCRLMELCRWCDFRGWMHKNVIVFFFSIFQKRLLSETRFFVLSVSLLLWRVR